MRFLLLLGLTLITLASSANAQRWIYDSMVHLKAERTRLPLVLLNLQSPEAPALAASVAPRAIVAGVGATEGSNGASIGSLHKPLKLSAEPKKAVKESSKLLAASITDRRIVQAALNRSNDVLSHMQRLNNILSGSESKLSE